MANTKSAEKAARQNQRRRLINVSRASEFKTYIKKFKNCLTQQNSTNSEAFELLQKCQSMLHRSVNKNILKPNNASRKISQIHKLFKNKFVSA